MGRRRHGRRRCRGGDELGGGLAIDRRLALQRRQIEYCEKQSKLFNVAKLYIAYLNRRSRVLDGDKWGHNLNLQWHNLRGTLKNVTRLLLLQNYRLLLLQYYRHRLLLMKNHRLMRMMMLSVMMLPVMMLTMMPTVMMVVMVVMRLMMRLSMMAYMRMRLRDWRNFWL